MSHCGEQVPEPSKHSTCPHEKRALAVYDRVAPDAGLLFSDVVLPVLTLETEPVAIETSLHIDPPARSHAPPELVILNAAFRI